MGISAEHYSKASTLSKILLVLDIRVVATNFS